MTPGRGTFGSANGAELVNGTLRGFRCWRLCGLPTGRTRVERRVRFDREWWKTSLAPDPAAPISLNDYYKDVAVPEYERVLTAVSFPVYWPAAEVRADVCTATGSDPRSGCPCPACQRGLPYGRYEHRPPVATCTCGIYGWYRLPDAISEHSAEVIGVVEVAGRVLLGTRGFRAERARVVAVAPLLGHPAVGAGRDLPYHLGDRYPDVRVFANQLELEREFPPDLDTLRNLGVEPAATEGRATLPSIAPVPPPRFSATLINTWINTRNLAQFIAEPADQQLRPMTVDRHRGMRRDVRGD